MEWHAYILQFVLLNNRCMHNPPALSSMGGWAATKPASPTLSRATSLIGSEPWSSRSKACWRLEQRGTLAGMPGAGLAILTSARVPGEELDALLTARGYEEVPDVLPVAGSQLANLCVVEQKLSVSQLGCLEELQVLSPLRALQRHRWMLSQQVEPGSALHAA